MSLSLVFRIEAIVMVKGPFGLGWLAGCGVVVSFLVIWRLQKLLQHHAIIY